MLAFAATATLLAVVLSIATFVAVRSYLEHERIRSATRQTIFTLQFSREFLAQRPSRAEELVTLLQTRGNFEAMVTRGSDWYSTELSLTPDAIPAQLRKLVVDERLGYEISSRAGVRTVVFGAPLPPATTNLFLFFSLSDTAHTMTILGRVLAVVGIIVVALALLIAQRVSRRIVRPLVNVSWAANLVAEGLLETRVESNSDDELGALTTSFNRMTDALQDRIEKERRFVAAVSHELRSPLTALKTATGNLVKHQTEMPPELQETVGLVAEDVADLGRLVTELLELSALDAGHAELRLEPVDMLALLRAITSRARRDASIEGDACVISTDKARAERVVSNLIDNAYEHGKGRDVRVTVEAVGDGCQLIVSDAGPGVSEADRPHLFDRFYRGDKSRARRSGGIGLGLALALENARMMGGTIHLDPDTSRTAFVVWLPSEPSAGRA